jgi:hypothetical protein
VLCCVLLCFVVLCCVVLFSVVLCCVVLCCVVLYVLCCVTARRSLAVLGAKKKVGVGLSLDKVGRAGFIKYTIIIIVIIIVIIIIIIIDYNLQFIDLNLVRMCVVRVD